MSWVVTGSRDGYPELWQALDALVAHLGKPRQVLVREQRGVDRNTRRWVRARGLELVPFEVDIFLPSPERYHDANQRMVDAAPLPGLIAAFPGPRSTGTWDCLRRGVRRGLRGYVCDPRTRRLVVYEPPM